MRNVGAGFLSILGLIVSCPGAGLTQDATAEAVAAQARLVGVWAQLPADIPERRYRVEALSFKARDESGVDWWGSDDVMVEVADSEGYTASDEIRDIDSGDTHEFLAARSCIVAVVPGEVVLGRSSFCDIDDIGNPAPIRFVIEIWEKGWFSFPAGFCIRATSGHHWAAHCVNDGNGDSFIGRGIVEFTAAELQTALPNVGNQFVETVVLSPCEEEGSTCGAWLFPDYSFTYRVTRVPDGKGFPQAEIAEAMRRTGARSELEVVMAGLRALHAPERRRIEPQEPPGLEGPKGNTVAD